MQCIHLSVCYTGMYTGMYVRICNIAPKCHWRNDDFDVVRVIAAEISNGFDGVCVGHGEFTYTFTIVAGADCLRCRGAAAWK